MIIMIFLMIHNNLIFAQQQNIEEFLEWPSGPSYSFVLIAIVIMIVLSIIANYFRSKRKGRKSDRR